MKKHIKLTGLLAAGLGMALGSQAFAINITKQDNDNTAWGFNGGPLGVGSEDNETENGTIASQVWDMEAFVVQGHTLSIVGGYNMQAGQSGGTGVYAPGDLFIKVGSPNPGNAPTTAGSGDVSNSGYNYTFAIDLTQPIGATLPLSTVYSLSTSSIFNTVVYDQFGSNPWKYASGGSFQAFTATSYSAGHVSGDAALTALGLGGLIGEGTGGNNLHNILTIDLGFMSVAAGTTVYFSYTMECGNDSLKGEYGGGFDRVPDSGSSIILMGLGLSALAFLGIKRK